MLEQTTNILPTHATTSVWSFWRDRKSQLFVGVIFRGEFPTERFRYLQDVGDERTVTVTD